MGPARHGNGATTPDRPGGWAGGTTALSIPWPATPDPELLTQAVAAMREVREFTLHEQVTSDTTGSPGPPVKVTLDGPRLLASDPYGSGVAPVAVRLDATGNQTTLGLAYPGESIYVTLVLAPGGRIQRETLTAPNHLVTRTFVYPHEEGQDVPHEH